MTWTPLTLDTTQREVTERTGYRAISFDKTLQTKRMLIVVWPDHDGVVMQDLLHGKNVPGGYDTPPHPLLVCDTEGQTDTPHPVCGEVVRTGPGSTVWTERVSGGQAEEAGFF